MSLISEQKGHHTRYASPNHICGNEDRDNGEINVAKLKFWLR